jgi:hypothetical protein
MIKNSDLGGNNVLWGGAERCLAVTGSSTLTPLCEEKLGHVRPDSLGPPVAQPRRGKVCRFRIGL